MTQLNNRKNFRRVQRPISLLDRALITQSVNQNKIEEPDVRKMLD